MQSISTNPPFTGRLANFLAGGRFPAFAICTLVAYQIFVAIMAFAPPGDGSWGTFVEDFRLRCFKYNPNGGGMDSASIWVMLSEPLPLIAIFLFIWRVPLLELWHGRRRAFIQPAAFALGFVGVMAISLMELGRSQANTVAPAFPVQTLRESLPMPAFALTNQDNQLVTPDSLKGRVVLITAVYSTCTTACPMMLSKIRSVLDELTTAERDNLAVVAFSLNPEADTRELRELTARMWGLKARFDFVNGLPSDVNTLLDKLNVSRTRDEDTGQLIHSNLFLLLDRDGRIAYRLSFSQNESGWLASALRTLLAEKGK